MTRTQAQATEACMQAQETKTGASTQVESQTIDEAARRFHSDESGATTLEYVLLLAAIGFPSYVIISHTLSMLLAFYQMMTAVNALPFP